MKLTALWLAYLLYTVPGWSSHDKVEDDDQATLTNTSRSTQLPTDRSIWGISEKQLDELFQQSSNLVCLVNPTHICRANAAWTQLLGWSQEELLARPSIEFQHPESMAASDKYARRASNSSIVHNTDSTTDNPAPKVQVLVNFENCYLSRQQEQHWLQWLILLQVAGSKNQPPLLCIAKNITQQKQAEEQKRALAQAQHATKMKSTFVAHMSHEIRTPLNGILGFIELALDEPLLSDKVRDYLQHAHTSALLLLDIANDIVDVSRIEAGALKIESIDFSPHHAVANAMSILELQAQAKKIILKSTIDSGVPAILKGDQMRFKQILLNLGSNAIKFTSHGKVSIKIDGYNHLEQPSRFILRGTVKDSGIGIEPQFIKQLFQPFSQEDQSMKRQFGGAGLGLYIIKQLCEKMGGSISVLSTPGLGSTFQFQVLMGQADTVAPLLDKPYTSLEDIKLSISRVLVVDDNIMNQEVLKGLLNRLGCHVDLATDGRQALDMIFKGCYELILMDGEMPVMDGLEATTKIRQQYTAQQLPIIGLTAHAMVDHRQQFLDAGMNGYLTKPLNRIELIREILRCCQTPALNIQ